MVVFFLLFVYTYNIMNYIIFDLEWNQCPDGKEFAVKSFPFEIIEIGAVKLDSEYHETSRFFERIRPSVYQSLHFKTREIIQTNIEDLKDARSFPEVLKDFLSWCGSRAHLCTWGPLDLFELQRNMNYYEITNPYRTPLRFYDIQKIFSILYEDRKSRRSLEYAADFLQLGKEMPFHSALSDAVYTSEVLKLLPQKEVLKNYSIDYYQNPKDRKEEIHATFDTHSKFISREFPSKTEAMKDWKVTSTKCYICHKNARRKVRWFANGNGSYFSLSYCEEHGWLKGKIRIKRAESGNYFCIKSLQLISPLEAEAIRSKKNGNKNKKMIKSSAS